MPGCKGSGRAAYDTHQRQMEVGIIAGPKGRGQEGENATWKGSEVLHEKQQQ